MQAQAPRYVMEMHNMQKMDLWPWYGNQDTGLWYGWFIAFINNLFFKSGEDEDEADHV